MKFNFITRFLNAAIFFLIANAVFLLKIEAQSTNHAVQLCNENLSYYEGFTVKAIHINTSLLISSITINTETLLQQTQQALKIENKECIFVDNPFSLIGYSNLGIQLNETIERIVFNFAVAKGLLFIKPHIIKCNDSLKEIEVEYVCIALATSGQSYVQNAFELPSIYLSENKTTLPLLEKKEFQITPYLGYNDSRSIYLGGRFFSQFEGKVINKFDLNTNVSTSSFTLNSALGGVHQHQLKLLNYAEWKLNYQYSNVEANLFKLNESTLSAQFFGASRSLASGSILFRYGTSIEGGNKMTNLLQSNLPNSYLSNSGYKAAKFYIGSASNWGRQSLKISYGIQLGNTSKDFNTNYIKHIFDLGYQIRFLNFNHKSLQVDAQFSAGSLNAIAGEIPIGERFFGGNTEKNFISGDSWHIRSNPFFRGISQNKLNGSNSGNPIGGDSYLSMNLTLSQSIWSKPMMPKEITKAPDLNRAFDLGIQANRKAIVDFEAEKLQKKLKIDISQIQDYKILDIKNLVIMLNDSTDLLQSVNKIILQIKPHQGSLKKQIEKLKLGNTGTTNSLLLDELESLNEIEYYATKIKKNLPTLEDCTDFDSNTQYLIEAIIVGYGDAIPSYIERITNGIKLIKKSFVKNEKFEEWIKLNSEVKILLSIQKKIKLKIKKNDLPLAEKEAKPKILYVDRILGVLFKELNIASISPFITLDIAQLKVNERSFGNDFRYGLGTGIKLSIANFNIYTGYSFNLKNQLNEGSGTFVFAIDVTNLF